MRYQHGYPGKRLVDVTVAIVLLLALSPVLGATAAAVRVSMGRPVLFRQRRTGRHGEPFEILKFRTMRDALGEDGMPLPDAQRLTSTGRFLRRTSLDELPELLNVIRGEMSLVGPRPLFPRYLSVYRPHELARLEVRPGITGLAQVSGRNLVPWDERLALDVEYVHNLSLRQDIRILVVTALQTIRGNGVSADPDLVETDLSEERADPQLG